MCAGQKCGARLQEVVFQDAPTLVFYDPRDFLRNIAFGCSLYALEKCMFFKAVRSWKSILIYYFLPV